MFCLNQDEEKWIRTYRETLATQFPGFINDFLLFGSKARGDNTIDSDIDVLIIIQNGDWRLKREIRDYGYELSIGTNVVPSIQVYSKSEWEKMKSEASVFQEVVEQEGISFV